MWKLIFLSIIILSSCKSEERQSLLNPENLETITFQAGPDTDTTITTAKGAMIRIVKGTFSEKVDLVIKEAYTMRDILLAGLATEADSSLLQSGGMIYIGTSDGKNPAIKKSIAINMPTDIVDVYMKLYKGEREGTGINWTNPDTIPFNTSERYYRGRALFQNYCRNCHGIFHALTGPEMAGVENQWGVARHQQLIEFIQNNIKATQKYDYARKASALTPTVMPIYDFLTDEDVISILEFIKIEEKKDRSEFDYVSSSDTSRAVFNRPDSIGGDYVLSGTRFDTIPPDTSLRDGFTDVVYGANYQFSISTLGWFNVDAAMYGLPGTELCYISATIESAELDDLSVYLFVPARKLLSVGLNVDGEFYFSKIGDKIPLFLNDDAFVLAFGERNNQFYYGLTKFKVTRSQNLKINVQPKTKEQFLQGIKNQNLDGIDFSIDKINMYLN